MPVITSPLAGSGLPLASPQVGFDRPQEVVMRKVFALCLICSLPLLVSGCENGQSGNGVGAQEQVGPLPGYGFESDVMPMAEVGRVLEQMGREMQQNGSATFLGVTYPLTGTASIEFGINRRAMGGQGLRTMFGVEFRSTLETDLAERSGRPGGTEGTEGNAYTHYEGRIATGTPAEVADALDQFAESLATAGVFAWDFHSAEFAGTAIIDQYLGQNTRNPRQPFRWMMDVAFGEGEVERHADREDIAEAQEEGSGVMLGTTSVEGADQAGVVESLRAFSAALRSGQIVVGDGEATLDADQVTLNWAHVAVVGGSDKIEMGLQWPSLPPPEPEAEPETAGPARYHDEPTNMPRAEFAEMLQRIAAEILEDGTFTFNGEEYTVGETIGGEIFFSAGGLSFEVGWRR